MAEMSKVLCETALRILSSPPQLQVFKFLGSFSSCSSPQGPQPWAATHDLVLLLTPGSWRPLSLRWHRRFGLRPACGAEVVGTAGQG